MRGVLGILIAFLLGAAAVGALATWGPTGDTHDGAAARAVEEAAPAPAPAEPDVRGELQRLQERFGALQADHDRAVARLRELEAGDRGQPAPLPYADFHAALAAGDGAAALHFLRDLVARGLYAEAVASWKALLDDNERAGLSQLDLLNAMTEQPDLMEFLLVDLELDADVRDFAAGALTQLDEETQVRMMDSIFAHHGLEQEIGRTQIALIDAMSGFEDGRSMRHVSQLNALIDSQAQPGLDHYASIVIASHSGPEADAAFELLAGSESAWVKKSLPVLTALHRPHVDHGAFVISPTVDGYLDPGDAVIESNGEKIGGWKELKKLVDGTDKGTLLPLVVVDVNGQWQTRYVPGQADLRCLGRDL